MFGFVSVFAVTIASASLSMAAPAMCLARDIRDYTELDLAKHGIELVEPQKDLQTGFIVGGVNETSSVLKLTELAGHQIEDLENDMRPGALGKGGSEAGFLGKEEKLLEVLARDNQYVVD